MHGLVQRKRPKQARKTTDTGRRPPYPLVRRTHAAAGEGRYPSREGCRRHGSAVRRTLSDSGSKRPSP